MKLATEQQIQALCAERAEYQELGSFRISEPRIEMIQRRLRALLRVVQLEENGQPVEIDGFRLRDLAQWTTPNPGPMSMLAHVSTACNMRCPFCYEEGDPDGSSVLNEPAEMMSRQELDTRLRHHDVERGTGLFRPLTYLNELFCHPEALEIIERVRAAEPHEVLSFVTNGTYLTREVVQRLARLKPIFFNFSVNSLDPEIRRRILRDPQPEVAIQAIELLREYEIPYLGSLVCWPTIPWADIEHTVRRLDQASCTIIRYSLSAYSKHLKGRRFDRLEFWEQGLAVARRLGREVTTPIKVEPYHHLDPSFDPNVVGVIRGSPAERAGIRAGERLLVVGGRSVVSANQALSALAQAARAGEALELTVQGAQGARRVQLDRHRALGGFPWRELADQPGFEWGLMVVDNLKFSYLNTMRQLIRRHGARRVLLCSSELMRPVVEKMLALVGGVPEAELRVMVPPNQYFGGTIVLGDLLVVEDYVRFIREEHAREPLDLVLIPSSPFSLGIWRRDLTGTPFTEISRRTGVPVELIECDPLAG